MLVMEDMGKFLVDISMLLSVGIIFSGVLLMMLSRCILAQIMEPLDQHYPEKSIKRVPEPLLKIITLVIILQLLAHLKLWLVENTIIWRHITATGVVLVTSVFQLKFLTPMQP